jgi:hypothetical protein
MNEAQASLAKLERGWGLGLISRLEHEQSSGLIDEA